MCKYSILHEFDKLRDAVFKEMEELEKSQHAFDQRFSSHAKLLKDLARYICSGLDFQQAIMALASDYDVDKHYLLKKFGDVNYQIKSMRLYAKWYVVKKMTLAGYTRPQIAETLNISIKTVERLKKTTVKI